MQKFNKLSYCYWVIKLLQRLWLKIIEKLKTYNILSFYLVFKQN